LLWLGDMRAENAFRTVTRFENTRRVTKISRIPH
jgi:hypothetical protein